MQALDHDLTIIKAVDPIPDPQAQELWSSALTRGQDRLLNGDTDYSAVVARLGSGFGVAPTATPS